MTVMNTSQTKSIDSLRQVLTDLDNSSTQWKHTITEFEVREDRGLVAVRAQRERTSLPKENLLRALDHEYWLVLVGVRGALTVKMGPRSFRQFNGRKAFGMRFDI